PKVASCHESYRSTICWRRRRRRAGRRIHALVMLRGMRVATWNINDINKRLPILLAWLETTRPDAVALQELKTTESEFPFAQLERAGYGCLVVGQPMWNGVALLARGSKPVPIRKALPGDMSDKQARYLEAAI